MCVCVHLVTSDSLWPHGPPGSSVRGILQARVLEWVAMSSSRGSSRPRDRTRVSFCLLHWPAGSLPLAPPELCSTFRKPSRHRPPDSFSGDPELRSQCAQVRGTTLAPSLPWVLTSRPSRPLNWVPILRGGSRGQQRTEESRAVRQSCQPHLAFISKWLLSTQGNLLPKWTCGKFPFWEPSAVWLGFFVFWFFFFCISEAFRNVIAATGHLCYSKTWDSLLVSFQNPDILEGTRDWFIQGMGLRHMWCVF